MKRMTHRQSRGFVLVVTLFTLMALTLTVAAYYAQTSEALVSSKQVAGAQIANSNAQFGLQQGILALRSNTFDNGFVSTLVTTASTCPTLPSWDYDASTCIAPNGGTTGITDGTKGYRSGLVSSTATGGNLAGGGLQYQYVVYATDNRICTLGGTDTSVCHFTVRSVGYFGSSLNSPNLIMAVMEAEVDLAAGSVSNYARPEGYEG